MMMMMMIKVIKEIGFVRMFRGGRECPPHPLNPIAQDTFFV